MILSGKQLAKEGFITNFLEENIQQQGIDLRLKTVAKLEGIGEIPKKGKTKKLVPTILPFDENNKIYLEPGYYEVYFEEGCSIPKNRGGKPFPRSSLVRCGGDFHCGWYDAGFETKEMGGFITVKVPLILEKGSRIVQLVIWDSQDVDTLYSGQWDGITSENAISEKYQK